MFILRKYKIYIYNIKGCLFGHPFILLGSKIKVFNLNIKILKI